MAKVLENEAEVRTRVRYEATAGVAVLTLDDPPANTYTYELMQDLDRAILRARMDESVHVVVLTGAGEKAFAAGADIQELADLDGVGAIAASQRGQRAFVDVVVPRHPGHRVVRVEHQAPEIPGRPLRIIDEQSVPAQTQQ